MYEDVLEVLFRAIGNAPGEGDDEGEGGNEDDPAYNEHDVRDKLPLVLLLHLWGVGADGTAAGQTCAEVNHLLLLLLLSVALQQSQSF